MNKTNFINELEIKLKNLPTKERQSAISYYVEYFEDAGVDDYIDVESDFGSPSVVASQILADYAVKEKPNRNQISSVWFIVLAIFASPIALPLAFAGVITIGALLFSFFVVLFAFGIAGFAIALSGVAVAVSGITILISDFATSILFIGVGAILAGLGILGMIGTLAISNISLKLVTRLGNNVLSKLNKKELN
ncbi:MAG: DUF1700 domain-containing protein [Romboutsia sp.]